MRIQKQHIAAIVALLALALGGYGASLTVFVASVVQLCAPVIAYAVVGNQIQRNGVAYLPRGIQVGAAPLASTDWQTNNDTLITKAAVDAASTFWKSNTTRIQVASLNYFTNPSAYLARMDQYVTWASADDMNTIISLQYQAISPTVKMPTQESVDFWTAVAAHFANNNRVWFDLFNEPNPKTACNLTFGADATAWNAWRNGCTNGTTGITYVGLNTLATDVRAVAPNNIIIAEGVANGGNTGSLSAHLLDATIGNVAYANHPYWSATNNTQTDWANVFGTDYSGGTYALIVDEWGEYQGTQGSCQTTAPTLAPTFFSYLLSFTPKIGLILYSYTPGTAIEEWNFTTPTFYASSTTVCTAPSPAADTNPNVEGVGQLALNDYLNVAGP